MIHSAKELPGAGQLTDDHIGHFPIAGMTRIRFRGCDLSHEDRERSKAPLVVTNY